MTSTIIIDRFRAFLALLLAVILAAGVFGVYHAAGDLVAVYRA